MSSNLPGKFVTQASRKKRLDLDQASATDKFRVFYHALENIREEITETRQENRFGEEFKNFIEQDVRPDLKYVSGEIKRIKLSRVSTPINNESLEKIDDHINDAIDELNAAIQAIQDTKNPDKHGLLKIWQICCRRCEKSLQEGQLLLETP